MIYILVIITIFANATGLASDMRFQEFDSRDACETARDGIVRGVYAIKGQTGREVFAACYAKSR